MRNVSNAVAQPGAYCNAQGRVIATFIDRLATRHLLLMPR